jgi:hypothetical protein
VRRASKWIAGITTSVAAAGLLIFGTGATSRNIEEPAYEVVETRGDFEIRAYAPRLVATTEVEGSARASSNRGFRILADYIFGNNASRTEIAMTAPVGQQPSEEIAMTAPVEQRPSGAKWVITFTMPSKYSLESLPRPLDARVEIRKLPAQRFAAIRFNGAPDAATVDRRKLAFARKLGDAGLVIAGEAIYARYDPPWTIPFLRRNEILIPLEE